MIDILIPTNRAKYLEGAIISAISQKIARVVVYDSSPNKDVYKLCQKYRVECQRLEVGLVEKLNHFLLMSKSDWVMILCDDDQLEEGCVEKMMEAAGDNVTSVRPTYRLTDENGVYCGEDNIEKYRLDSIAMLEKVFLPKDCTFTMNVSGVLFRRKVLLDMGGFVDMPKGLHSDRLAWAMLASKGVTICLPDSLCSLRMHNESMSRRPNRLELVKTLCMLWLVMRRFRQSTPKHLMTNRVKQRLSDYLWRNTRYTISRILPSW